MMGGAEPGVKGVVLAGRGLRGGTRGAAAADWVTGSLGVSLAGMAGSSGTSRDPKHVPSMVPRLGKGHSYWGGRRRPASEGREGLGPCTLAKASLWTGTRGSV